jgi:hypothetical protein
MINFEKIELVLADGRDNFAEEFLNFRDESLTDEATLLKHLKSIRALESCDPLSPIYRIGTTTITPYNFWGRQNA